MVHLQLYSVPYRYPFETWTAADRESGFEILDLHNFLANHHEVKRQRNDSNNSTEDRSQVIVKWK